MVEVTHTDETVGADPDGTLWAGDVGRSKKDGDDSWLFRLFNDSWVVVSSWSSCEAGGMSAQEVREGDR